MQLVIKNGKVIATHPDNIKITQDQYPDCEIILFEGEIPAPIFENDKMILPDDPRTKEEKKEYYKDQRRLEYPTVEEQLDLMYWDRVNGTTKWQKTVKAIKDKYPKT